jgi:hypothetical protein
MANAPACKANAAVKKLEIEGCPLPVADGKTACIFWKEKQIAANATFFGINMRIFGSKTWQPQEKSESSDPDEGQLLVAPRNFSTSLGMTRLCHSQPTNDSPPKGAQRKFACATHRAMRW